MDDDQAARDAREIPVVAMLAGGCFLDILLTTGVAYLLYVFKAPNQEVNVALPSGFAGGGLLFVVLALTVGRRLGRRLARWVVAHPKLARWMARQDQMGAVRVQQNFRSHYSQHAGFGNVQPAAAAAPLDVQSLEQLADAVGIKIPHGTRVDRSEGQQIATEPQARVALITQTLGRVGPGSDCLVRDGARDGNVQLCVAVPVNGSAWVHPDLCQRRFPVRRGTDCPPAGGIGRYKSGQRDAGTGGSVG